MATKYWIGAAPNVADVWTFTPSGSLSAGEVAAVSLHGIKAQYTIQSGDSLATICTGLASAINSSGASPYWREGAAVSTGTAVTWTVNETGRPASGTPTNASTGGTTTVGVVNTQAATGRNWVNVAANWSGNALPQAGDDLVFEQGNVSCCYGMAHFAATSFATISVRNGYSGAIGLPKTRSVFGVSGLTCLEQLPQYFQASVGVLRVGERFTVGAKSSLCRFDTRSSACAVVCEATGATADPSGLPAFCWTGDHTGNSIFQSGGDFGQMVSAAKVGSIRQSGGRAIYTAPALTSGGSFEFVNCAVLISNADFPEPPLFEKGTELAVRESFKRDGVEVFNAGSGTIRIMFLDPGQIAPLAFSA